MPARALTRPNIQDLRATQLVGADVDANHYPPIRTRMIRCSVWIVVCKTSTLPGSGSREAIRPEADDCGQPGPSSNGISSGGYLSAAVFKKDLENIINTGDQTVGQITLDGQTVDVVYNGQINQSTADLKGFELAYQQFFDQLPGWMSHLGVQANYTNIQA